MENEAIEAIEVEAPVEAPVEDIEESSITFDSGDDEPEAVEEEPTEESGESEEDRPVVKFTPEQQAVFNDAMNKKTAKLREIERKAEQAQQELEEARSQIPKAQRPNVPDYPDTWDDDYEGKMAARDRAVIDASAYDARDQYQQQQEQQEAYDAQVKVDESLYKASTDYGERAKKLGIPGDELQRAAQTVADYQLPIDVVRFILNEDQGPNITMYLSKNPAITQELRGMSSLEAAVKISTEIKVAAQLANKRSPPPPAPTDSVRGTGLPEGKRGPKGATFE
jgi:hypothetical protein